MDKAGIKVLVATGIYPPEIGGPATYTALLEREMPKRGIQISVLPFRTVRRLPKILRHIAFFLKVLNRGRKADVLYAQDPVSVGFPTMLAAKILGKPFLARIAGDYAWEQAAQRFAVVDTIDEFQNKRYGWRTEILKKVQSLTTESADRIITPSRYFRDLVAGWNPGRNNVMTIYNGIDFSDIGENSGRFEPQTLISAGRLVPWKGFDVLIGMMKELPGWKLSIAGDGPDKERLSRLIKEEGAEAQVFMLGSLKRADLMKKIQECEIFVLNTSFESFSFQIVESMYAGTPVISTDIGNISEIIEDGQDGLLVPPNDKQEILNAIRKLEDPEVRAKITANAKEKAKEFSIEKTVSKTAEVISFLARDSKKSIFKRNILLRFLLAGLAGAFTQIGLLYVFTDIAGLWYIYSSVLAFAAAIAVSFNLQKFWTFADKEMGKIHSQFARYFAVAVFGVVLNTALLYLFVDVFGIWYILAQVITSGIIAAFNFFVYKFLIFNRKPR